MATTGTGQSGAGKGSGAGRSNTNTTTTGQSSAAQPSASQSTAGQAGSQSFATDESRDRRAAGEHDSSGGIAQTLRSTTYRSIDDQKSRASETLGSVAGAVRGMSQPLREGGQPQIAEYVTKAADGIERWASDLRQQDLEDAVRAVEQFARRQPAMFLGLAFGVGLLAARFLKSSGDDRGTQRYGSRFNSSPGAGPTSFGSTGVGSTGMGSTGTGAGVGSSTSANRGDIPRLSGDIRSAGEVL